MEADLPAGLKEQIDDLDQLLDQLLKLPIDRVQPAPATLPLKPKSVAMITKADVIEEPETTILRFDGEEKKPTLTLADHSEEDEEELTLADEPNFAHEVLPHGSHAPEETGSTKHQTELSINNPLTPNLSSRRGEGSQTQTDLKTSLPVEEIPWIDDEPLPGARGKGPLVEIIQGPTSNIVMAPSREVDRPNTSAVKRHGWVFWIFWTVNWCFDQTFGHWFPWLRRPSVKFILGLIGVALFAVSIYLVWSDWLR